jgi:hypothetical protein
MYIVTKDGEEYLDQAEILCDKIIAVIDEAPLNVTIEGMYLAFEVVLASVSDDERAQALNTLLKAVAG